MILYTRIAGWIRNVGATLAVALGLEEQSLRNSSGLLLCIQAAYNLLFLCRPDLPVCSTAEKAALGTNNQ